MAYVGGAVEESLVSLEDECGKSVGLCVACSLVLAADQEAALGCSDSRVLNWRTRVNGNGVELRVGLALSRKGGGSCCKDGDVLELHDGGCRAKI